MPNISQRGVDMPASPIRKLAPLADAAKQRGVQCFGVAAGVQIALDLVAVQVHNNEHSGRQFVIFHAGRLDDKQALPAVNA